jgi:DNA polymerase III alpha subunit
MIVLGAKTDYSFLRGFGTPEQWLERCKALGVTTLGLADYNSTWGHAPFRDAFKGSGIKLLYGVQVPVVGFLDKDPRHSLVTLYASTDLSELYAATSKAQEQTYYRPRLTWRDIKELKSCVVVVNNLLRTHVRAAMSLDSARTYMGDNGDLPAHMDAMSLARVIDYSPRFPAPDDREGFKIFQSMSNMQRIGEGEQEPIHMLRDGELSRFFDAHDVGVMNAKAHEIADACTADIPMAGLLPYAIEDKRAALLRMAEDGAIKLGLAFERPDENSDEPGMRVAWNDTGLGEYQARLDRELDIIVEKKFEDYFFFVADICEWADKRMLIGPGRGSAGGSLLCYLLGITHVDPLRYGTMFDRFIDITRSDLPDIDIDFPDNRREEVFEYMRSKWGADCFARLGTLTELGGKSALNAVARATDVPFDASREIGKWTEGAGQGVVIKPAWIFENVPEVQPILEKHPSLHLAAVIDGHVSHHGVHASGVVVTKDPVSNYGTVDREGVLSMDMRTAEKQGFVKMDVLGLKTLSVIQKACDLAGIDPRELRKLDFNDLHVFDTIFNKDAVTGIFQFDGNAVRGLMKGITVDKFDDLCALTSLARPGPLVGGAAGKWVKARRGDEEARASIHPSLDSTYGVICYQEQMMNICRDCAGFDIPSVNGMRRAVAKKDPEKLAAYRPAFVEGMTKFFLKDANLPDYQTANERQTLDMMDKVGDAQGKAEELWEEICEFGSYAFNLAHAVAYAMLSYMTAWLKAKYPLQFAVAQLEFAADEDDTKHLLRELIEEGFAYVPFDAQKSAASWSIVDGKLYGGFDSIRGIGIATARRHVAAREANPQGWLEKLTESQRAKITGGVTPWETLSYFTDKFKGLYADPGGFKCDATPKGIRPPVYRLRDLPEAKGEYAFLGRITSKKHVDGNEPARVDKRGGKKFTKDTHFINLTIEDDTGEVGATINRFKAKDFEWLIQEDLAGRDFLFRGNVIEEGRKWLFLDKVIELK